MKLITIGFIITILFAYSVVAEKPTSKPTSSSVRVSASVVKYDDQWYCEVRILNVSDNAVVAPPVPGLITIAPKDGGEIALRTYDVIKRPVETIRGFEGRIRLIPLGKLDKGEYVLRVHMPKGFAELDPLRSDFKIP